MRSASNQVDTTLKLLSISALLSVCAFAQQGVDWVSQIANKPYVDIRSTTFRAQVPGGSLSASVGATVTLRPCPIGVNGSDSNHYLYVAGGTGAAEAVLITGGTCTSGNGSGTLTFTPANSHSGAWTIATATAGIQEALNTTATAATVYVPPGIWTINAPITLPLGSSLMGPNDPAAYADLSWTVTSGAAMINLHNQGCTVKNLFLIALAGSMGAAFDITASAQEIMSVYGDSFHAGFISIHGNPFDIRVTNFQHYYSFNPGNATTSASTILIQNSGSGGGGGNYWFSNFKLAGTGNPATSPSGITIHNGAGLWFQNGYVTQLNDGVSITPSTGDGVANIDFNSVDSDANNSGYGYRLQPFSATGSIFGIFIRGSKAIFNTAGGVLIDGTLSITTNVLISDSEFGDNVGAGVKIFGANLSYLNLHDNYVFGNGYTAPPNTVPGVSSDGAGSHIYIHHNRVGGGNVLNPLGGLGGVAETQLNGINLGAGAGTDWQVKDNNVLGNVSTGMVNIPTGTGVIVNDNPGYNPVGPSTLSCSASPCTLPATASNSLSTLYLAGGTVSSVTRGGSTVCTSSPCAIALSPGQQAVVTYSSVPTTITLDVR